MHSECKYCKMEGNTPLPAEFKCDACGMELCRYDSLRHMKEHLTKLDTIAVRAPV